jgi:K+-transporting ATPase ATPase C chain
MNIKGNLIVAVLMTIVTTVLLGVIYPLAITAIAQVAFPAQANGQLIERNGTIVGSRIIGQGFSSTGYFRSRPSAAGHGLRRGQFRGQQPRPDEQEAGGRGEGQRRGRPEREPDVPVPVDLVTTSASGFDPHVSPAAADFQVPRVARERGVSELDIRQLVDAHTEGRTFGFFGERA